MSRPLASTQADIVPVSGEFLESHHCILPSHQGPPGALLQACFSHRGLAWVVDPGDMRCALRDWLNQWPGDQLYAKSRTGQAETCCQELCLGVRRIGFCPTFLTTYVTLSECSPFTKLRFFPSG